MSRSALILAAHGSNSSSNMNEMVGRFAQTIAGRNLFDEVSVAFHQGEPAFTTVLDHLTASDIIVVPMMTSAGYYYEVVLPQELNQNRRINEVNLRCTRPVGVHPMMASLVSDRVNDRLRTYKMDQESTTLVIIGHGTPRHRHSRQSTFQLADTLREKKVCNDVLTAFLDDFPEIETVHSRAAHQNILIEPFFIGDGLHTRQDIPRRLGLDVHPDTTLPLSQSVGKHRIAIDSAIGTDARIVDIILDLANEPQPSRLEVLT